MLLRVFTAVVLSVVLLVQPAWTQVSPESAEKYNAGQDMFKKRRYQDALAAFEDIIKRAPGFAEGWNKRSTLFYLAGEHHRSKADAKKTLELEPRHFGALSGLGLIHLAHGEEEMALEAFEKAILIHPFVAGANIQIQDLRKKLRSRPV